MCCQMCTSVPSGGRVYLFLLRESKMYLSGTIANSKRTPTEMRLIFKLRILVEQVIATVRHLTTLRIISNEKPVLLLVLCR